MLPDRASGILDVPSRTPKSENQPEMYLRIFGSKRCSTRRPATSLEDETYADLSVPWSVASSDTVDCAKTATTKAGAWAAESGCVEKVKELAPHLEVLVFREMDSLRNTRICAVDALIAAIREIAGSVAGELVPSV